MVAGDSRRSDVALRNSGNEVTMIQAASCNQADVAAAANLGSVIVPRGSAAWRLIGRFVLLFFAVTVVAQTPQHTATLTWTNSPDTPNTNVYRQSGPCSAVVPTSIPSGATLLTQAPVTTGTYADSGIAPGQYCYYVAATLNGVLSSPIQSQATVPLAPPTGLAASVK